MKDQQRPVQQTQEQQPESVHEHRETARGQPVRLPAQQAIQLLRRQDGLLELPVRFLEELAETVGNQNLTELLRQGGDGPATYVLRDAPPADPEPAANAICTTEPLLLPMTNWPARSGRRPRLSRPKSIRDRGP